jgi:hypothetical protein
MTKLTCAIHLYNHYKNQAANCWKYHNLVDGYFMYDYYMEMAGIYELIILEEIYK